jgi:hypothetical protein
MLCNRPSALFTPLLFFAYRTKCLPGLGKELKWARDNWDSDISPPSKFYL